MRRDRSLLPPARTTTSFIARNSSLSTSRLPEGFVEGVAGSADGSDGVTFAALREGLAQAPDVDVDRALVDLRRLPPHAVQELRAREHTARLLQEIFEQPELG